MKKLILLCALAFVVSLDLSSCKANRYGCPNNFSISLK